MEGSLPLHQTTVHRISAVFNRCFALFHSIAVSVLIYYRASFLRCQGTKTALPWLLVSVSELLLFFIWLLGQASRWKPVSRTAFPDRLPKPDDDLPSIDVFICTADPEKEPTLEVLNTVLSAMSMDYPVEKLNVYLSDDAGSRVTLEGMREACRFAKWWVPFCRKYRIRRCCPQAYFLGDDDGCGSDESLQCLKEKEMIKEKYEAFKEQIERCRDSHTSEEKTFHTSRGHPALVEVIEENTGDSNGEVKSSTIPLLVYVARQKSPSQPHHFKAGALNVLLRVSGLMSNSPYILGLDCDMFCNDPSSAKQAMCFHLDPRISPSLAYVVFPQKFNNISSNDIYDSQLQSFFRILWPGMDGLKGPCFPGTNFYIKRKSLYAPSVQQGVDLTKIRSTFGPSNEFVKSLQENPDSITIYGDGHWSRLHQETKFVASCAYEDETQWGKEVGFLYNVVEDYFTSFMLQCKGWTSVFVNPSRPQFLGTSTTTLNDVLTQQTRWGSGMVEVTLSKIGPLIYGPSRLSLLQSMCFAELASFPLFYCLPLWCLATVPQLCLLNGIPLFPEVSSPFFKVYSLVFLSALTKQLQEVLARGGSVQMWINEQRIWMMKSVTCHLYGSLDAIMKKLNLRPASFVPTNKDTDLEQTNLYQNGVFDFQAPAVLLSPLVLVATGNLASLIGGLVRAIVKGDLDKMFVQVFLSAYIVVVNYAVLEGMIIRKDKGRIKPSVSAQSTALAFLFLVFGSIVLVYLD